MKCALKMALAISYQINTHEMVGTICLLMDEFQISARQFTINEKFSLGQRSQLRQKLEAPTSLLIIVFGNYMLANINLIVFYFFIKVLNDRACVYIIRTKTITPSNSWAVDKNECCGYFFSIWVLKKMTSKKQLHIGSLIFYDLWGLYFRATHLNCDVFNL